MFAALEAKLRTYWHDLTGEARAELEKALADVKAEEAKFGPLVTEAKADVAAIIAALEPEVKAAVESRLAQLVKDVETLLASGL